MGLKEDGMKRAKVGLGRQLSHSMDNLCIRRENAKTIDHAVVSRLSKSIDNLCSEREEPNITQRNTMSKEADRRSEYFGKRKTRFLPNMFSKATNRLSNTVDNLFQRKHAEYSKTRFLPKASNALGMKGFRKDRQKDIRCSHNSMPYFEDDIHEIDNDATVDDVHDCLEFHPEGKDEELYHRYKGKINL